MKYKFLIRVLSPNERSAYEVVLNNGVQSSV